MRVKLPFERSVAKIIVLMNRKIETPTMTCQGQSHGHIESTTAPACPPPENAPLVASFCSNSPMSFTLQFGSGSGTG